MTYGCKLKYKNLIIILLFKTITFQMLMPLILDPHLPPHPHPPPPLHQNKRRRGRPRRGSVRQRSVRFGSRRRRRRRRGGGRSTRPSWTPQPPRSTRGRRRRRRRRGTGWQQVGSRSGATDSRGALGDLGRLAPCEQTSHG